MSFQDLKKDIRENASKERARASARFFKTGKGEYGEGDRFLGLTMGEVRKLSKQYR
ncbi:MAG: DNA alkylation repair protein, partial [Candidatus Moraniibacteriota bacterium]